MSHARGCHGVVTSILLKVKGFASSQHSATGSEAVDMSSPPVNNNEAQTSPPSPDDDSDSQLSTYPNYVSEYETGSLADFFKKLHSPEAIANEDYLKVKIVSFTDPADGMEFSGILEWLGLTEPEHFEEPTDPAARLPGILGNACDMIRSCMDAHGRTVDFVPYWKWWQVIVLLMRQCVNIVTIEAPMLWEEPTWQPGQFPLVQYQSGREVENGQWRWGQDFEEIDE